MSVSPGNLMRTNFRNCFNKVLVWEGLEERWEGAACVKSLCLSTEIRKYGVFVGGRVTHT